MKTRLVAGRQDRVHRPASDSEIFAMNADGSGQTNLTDNRPSPTRPDWSPDGTNRLCPIDRAPTSRSSS